MLDAARRDRRGRDRRGAARADRAGRPVRRGRGGGRRPHDQRVPREAQGRGRPRRRARPGLRLDGQLRLHAPRRSWRRCARTPRRRASKHDMGGNIVPMLVERGAAHVYDFSRNTVPGESERDRGYWRDVGTLDAFFDAHMDLISVHPVFNLYNQEWPILTWPDPLPPAKFVFEEEGRTGHALDSMVCAGVVISGATVRRSVLSPGVHLHSYAEVEDSILFPGVDVAPLGGRAPRDPRQGRARARGRAGRRRPRGGPASASRSPTAGSSWSARAWWWSREGRAAHPRVPARRLRRRRRARRVPRARARAAGGAVGARVGRRPRRRRRPRGVGRAGG